MSLKLALEETSTYDDAKYVMFSKENVLNEDLSYFNLTQDKLYPIHEEDDSLTQSSDYYIINDEGIASFIALKCVKRKLYK
ncbi:hypothetical protein [Paenibacillus sp. LK1]|uniref:hypothetical protein n=1 Tax=Paenibacillus sp. LK1 TaxID=2053014 RepID=UPI000C1801E8|nr:hypothetical protein [Paenibacillus sp. LK1]PIH61534.1 hypothetical protein CS562_03760 [Paenibacillus sp. LK1]